MAPQEDDLEWQIEVLESHEEVVAEWKILKQTRSKLITKTLVEATVCMGQHSIIAELFYTTFPYMCVYLNKGK